MFDIINHTEDHADFIIAKRLINCNNITREEFINILCEDAHEAIMSYTDNVTSRAIDNGQPSIPTLGFFDMDGNCGTKMGISTKCILSEESFNDAERIGECYDALTNSAYFKKAIGWQFKYYGRTDTYTSSFRPVIELLFDEETSKEIKEAKHSLNKSINSFYKN